MHYQLHPYEEVKLVRCTMGTIFDVIIDLRPDSATFKQHYYTILSAQNRLALYVPKGFAHGFQTLEDGTEVFYQMSQYYRPEAASGVRWDDQAFGIAWPSDERIITERDRNYPDFRQP
jgi:dTDP-4-dehydrorhamnose 3,5-epimerase